MKTWKKYMSVMLAIILVLNFTGCSILPKEQQPSITPEELAAEEKMAQEVFIDHYKMASLVDFLMHLEPILSEEEKAKQDAEMRQKMPFRVATPDLINYCTSHANAQIQTFLKEFGSDKYEIGKETRNLKQIYDGATGVEVNGGVEPKIIGFETGYWRITNCNYYNQVFFTNQQNNSVRILYRCNMYHYLLKKADNLADTPDLATVGAMTTENTDVKEYENAFLVVTINNVCPMNVKDSLDVAPQGLQPEILMFKDYESAMKSFSNPEHTFENLYMPDDFKGTVVDGYAGKPLVIMPELVGQFVDVSTPDTISALEKLGIKNYRVKWEQNDGSKVAYSILSTSHTAGEIIDITDKSLESCIEVVVAEKTTEKEVKETTEKKELPEEKADSSEENVSEKTTENSEKNE